VRQNDTTHCLVFVSNHLKDRNSSKQKGGLAMSDLNQSPNMGKRFRNTALFAGILLLGLGVLGMAAPQFMSVVTASFFGWLLVTAGALMLYVTYQGFGGEGALRWLKPFILIVVGFLVAFHPVAGAAGLGLALGVYLMFDGFSSISTAFTLRPMHGWMWTGLNGVLSFVLSFFILVGWPVTSLWIVGLYVGISLFFDGLALLMFRRAI